MIRPLILCALLVASPAAAEPFANNAPAPKSVLREALWGLEPLPAPPEGVTFDWSSQFRALDTMLKNLHGSLLNNHGVPRPSDVEQREQAAAAWISVLRRQAAGIGDAVTNPTGTLPLPE